MTYLSTVLADTPVHYWRLADTGQVTHDIGSNPTHLLAPQTNPGYTGIASDGGSFFVQGTGGPHHDTSIPSLASPISLECWFWLGWLRSAIQPLIMWDGRGAAPSPQLYLDGANKLTAYFSGAAAFGNPVATTDQTWHHAVATWDNANAKLYLDGAQVATQVLAGPATTSHPIGVGSYADNGNQIYGCICEVAIYSTALSSARVSAHYAAKEVSSTPNARVGGTIDLTTGAPTIDSSQLATILSCVRKTYTFGH